MNQKSSPASAGRGRNAAARITGLLGCAALLSACGGGGDGGDAGNGGGSGWTPGVFLPSDTFAAQCVNPRSGTDPATGQPWPDVQGVVLDENNFLRSYSDETYLWFDEIVDQDPGNFNDPIVYFDELRTMEKTPSGADKDRFHFTLPTDEWFELSQSGVSAGYGAAWIVIAPSPPREIVVAFTEPGSPATEPDVDLVRGARVLEVDDVNVENGDAATLNAGLFPAGPGETHTFTVQDQGANNTREITMTSAEVESTPVQNVGVVASPMGPVGYLLFNDHIATAETGLIDAIEALATEDVVELVVDIRYNGGGFLAIASQLAYMIAGDVQTAGRTFEEIQFNEKHPSTNPVTGQPLQPMPFFDETLDFSEPAGQPLPSLDLQRVYVLTGPNSCSASESIMNGLRGVDVEVVQVGATTCGKPYGFFPTDNCGTTYFTIQFRGVNEKDFGDYADGFTPVNGAGNDAAELPGCMVADDFEHQLGDPLEARFQTALALIGGEDCPAATASALAEDAAKTGAPLSATDGIVPKSAWRENRILRQQP